MPAIVRGCSVALKTSIARSTFTWALVGTARTWRGSLGRDGGGASTGAGSGSAAGGATNSSRGGARRSRTPPRRPDPPPTRLRGPAPAQPPVSERRARAAGCRGLAVRGLADPKPSRTRVRAESQPAFSDRRVRSAGALALQTSAPRLRSHVLVDRLSSFLIAAVLTPARLRLTAPLVLGRVDHLRSRWTALL